MLPEQLYITYFLTNQPTYTTLEQPPMYVLVKSHPLHVQHDLNTQFNGICNRLFQHIVYYFSITWLIGLFNKLSFWLHH